MATDILRLTNRKLWAEILLKQIWDGLRTSQYLCSMGYKPDCGMSPLEYRLYHYIPAKIFYNALKHGIKVA